MQISKPDKNKKHQFVICLINPESDEVKCGYNTKMYVFPLVTR